MNIGIAIAFLVGFVVGGIAVNIVWLRNTPQRRKRIIAEIIEDDEASASFGQTNNPHTLTEKV